MVRTWMTAAVMAATLAAGAIPVAASAHDWGGGYGWDRSGWDRGDWRAHEWREREWREHARHEYFEHAYRYGYAPRADYGGYGYAPRVIYTPAYGD